MPRSLKISLSLGVLLLAGCVLLSGQNSLLVFNSSIPAFACADGAPGCTVTTARTCSISSSTTCASPITVALTAAHSVEVLCAGTNNTGVVTVSSTSDGGFTPSVASQGNSAAGAFSCAYNLNATGGATTIACTVSTSASAFCLYFNFTVIGTPVYDTGAVIHDTTCTSCVAPAMTLGTANNYILIQAMRSASGTISSIDSSFNAVFVGGAYGMAYLKNTTSVVTPTWTAASGQTQGSAIAIYTH